MKAQAALRAAGLLRGARVAALSTMHGGEPAVSMTPYALLEDPLALVLLVSRLAAHTGDMLAHPRVALMVAEPDVPGATAHALARVCLEARAVALDHGEARHAAARAAYSARFPDMAMLFELGDFLLFAIEPLGVRVVVGFAQAASITPASLAEALAGLRGS